MAGVYRNTVLVLVAMLCLTLAGVGQAEDMITIGKSDFLIGKSEILEDVKRLIGQAEVSVDTADYARRHLDFQQKVARAQPPVSSWEEAERDLVGDVPKPSEVAVARYAERQDALQQEQDERARKLEETAAARRRNNLEQERLDAIRNREATAADLRRRELELLEDRYENRYPVYGYPVYPVRPHHPHRLRPNRPQPKRPSPTPSWSGAGYAPQ